MKKTVFAIFCMILIISTPISTSALDLFDLQNDERNLGEALIINVDHVEPTVIDSDLFMNRDFETYVFLRGTTLGTFLFGDNVPENAPFFGDMKIKNIALYPDTESLRYVSGLSQITPPKGQELVIDSNGNIDLGYTKVRIRKQTDESEIPDEINIDVTAKILFDVSTGFGEFGAYTLNLVPSPDETAWRAGDYKSGEIWGGRGYLRLISLQGNRATLELYDGQFRSIRRLELTAGAAAKQVDLPGGPKFLENQLTLKLEKIHTAPSQANLMIDNNGNIDFNKVVVEDMRPIPGSSWTVDTIYEDAIVFINEDGVKQTLKKIDVTQPLEIDYTESNWENTALDYRRSINNPINENPCSNVDKTSTPQLSQPQYSADNEYLIKYETKSSIFSSKDYWFKYLGERPGWVFATTKDQDPYYFSCSQLSGNSEEYPDYTAPVAPEGEDQVLANLCQDVLSTNDFEKGLQALVRYANSKDNGNDDKIRVLFNGKEIYSPDHGEATVEQLEQYYKLTTSTSGSITIAGKASDLTSKTSTQLYCVAIQEYENAIGENPTDLGLVYDSYMGIAKSYDEMDVIIDALKMYREAEKYSQYSKDNFDFEAKYESIYQRINNAYSSVTLGDGIIVTLLDTQTTKEKIETARYTVDGVEKPKISKNQQLDLGVQPVESNEPYSWVVEAINPDSIVVRQHFSKRTGRILTLSLDQENLVPYEDQKVKTVVLQDTDVSGSAIILVSPGAKDNYGTSYFTIHLPIEERLIQWTPEELDKKIASTENAMNKLDNIINKLGNIVRTWKGLCFAVFAFLTVKNSFFSNPVGRKLAVQRMDKECTALVKQEGSEYNGKTVDECMSARSDELEKWVDESEAALKKTEEIFDGFNWKDEDSVQKAANEVGVSSQELIDMYDYGYLDAEQLRDAIHAKQAGWSEAGTTINEIKAKNEQAKLITERLNNIDGYKEMSDREKSEKIRELTTAQANKITTTPSTTHLDTEDKKVETFFQQHNEYPNVKQNSLVYENVDGTYYTYDENLNKVTVEPLKSGSEILSSRQGDYYVNAETKDVYVSSAIVGDFSRVYSEEPAVYYDKENKNRPTYIPFQISQKSNIPNNDKIGSGYANYIEVTVDDKNQYHYSIINVGQNGKLDIGADGLAIPNGDDRIVMDSSLFEVDANPTAKTAPYTSLLNQIKSAYRDANVGVKEGGTVRVGTKTYAVEIIDTKTASALTQCTYLMPETDCRILFGVCDPVMCPVSRFNLGGTWDVGPSVVQSGIIGSIVLGLPNFNIPYEPVPVCLTGIHAGLENIYSMLGSYRDCLETAKIKGESVGICNEIRSIYICDILWQEGLALFNTFGNLRNIIGTNLFGSGASGEIGLDWENSWDQLSNNVNFFTKQYANEAFAAFNARSTQEIGSEICKVAIFGKNPAGGNLLSQLTEPESPPQFTGWFEEQVTTSVDRTGILDGSVPPSYGTGQSAYRIYYHIYAGRNTDVRYRVYLTDAVGNRLPVTDESGFSLGGTRYLKKGNSVDKSFVITGMEPGFTQMCIEINGASSCGFGSVTSSFSMQYLKEQLIKNELEKEDIKTKEDCVPDEPYYKPGLIQNGIKRVCSVYDPDGVSAEWVVVGSCGYDEKDRFIGDCYLYTKDLDFYDLTYNLQGTVANISKQYLQNQTQVTQEDITEAKQRLEELKTTEQSSTSEQKINKIIPEYRKLIAWDIDRDINAESYYRIAEIYRTLANGQIQLEVSSTVTPTENTGLGFSDLPSLMNYLTTNTLGNRLCSCGENCEDYANWILKYSNEYGINPLLVLSVIMQESQCAADSCGPDGCTGLMQIEPTTAAELCGVTDVDSQLNGVSNAEANIECGIKVLKEKYDIYKDGAKSITCQTEPARTKYTSYTGWQAALRGYNGWGCAANVNTNYVEEVWERYLGITSLYNGEYSIYINNVASEYTTDLTRPEDGNCETEGEQSCDAWTSCYVKKEKFLIDELKSDSCKDCANLKTCPDIKNKDKCNDKSCASLAGLSCEWSDDKGVCANII